VSLQAGRGGATVANSKSHCLHAAAACLQLAQRTADTTIKMKLIDMAQFWINMSALVERDPVHKAEPSDAAPDYDNILDQPQIVCDLCRHRWR
jgi:hypothetical protein